MLVNEYIESIWPLHINEINCTGDEARLLNCPHNGVGAHNQHCTGLGDAGVICQCEFIQSLYSINT